MKEYNKILVLNSANMFNDGIYDKKSISKNQFIKFIQNAKRINSSIGYESISKLIEKLTGVIIPVKRERTIIDNDSIIVGLTIPLRLSEKSKGRRNPEEDDYVYFMATYKRNIS